MLVCATALLAPVLNVKITVPLREATALAVFRGDLLATGVLAMTQRVHQHFPLLPVFRILVTPSKRRFQTLRQMRVYVPRR